MSRVSIIIPTWNLVDYLRECLSKIVANTTTGLTYEIIVVDNGSTDATPEAARKAVDELVNAATCFEAAHSNPLFGDYKEESIADLQRTKAAVIEMMGVENA